MLPTATLPWTLVEPCAGSAALTLHLLGAKRSVLPYQGSKWRFRHALEGKVRDLGFEGSPEHVVLTDPGPWGVALEAVLDRRWRTDLIARLKGMGAKDPRAVFDCLHGSLHADAKIEFSAEFLFLQRLAFSGKAVGVTPTGCWNSPGFNKTSAYGLEATDRFGRVHPMVPSLIRVLESYNGLDPSFTALRQSAFHPKGRITKPYLVYLDPPYEGSTAYPGGSMTRDQVIALARAWHDAGAAVIVSEAEPLEELVGWRSQRLYKGRDDTSPFRGKQEEWITFTRPHAKTKLD